MPEELTPEEVALLIQAKKLLNKKGLPRNLGVNGICEHAGISRITGYQWVDKLEQQEKQREQMQEDLAKLQTAHEQLKRDFEDVSFENRGRHYEASEKKKAVIFLRHEPRPFHDISWVLSLRNSTLSEWNRFFDEQFNALYMPDQRGKAGKITTELVVQVVKAARQERDEGKRLRIKSFTRKLAEQGIVLSKKTVADILTANDLYKVRIKKRRPQFYQSLRQNIPNGLLSVDGKEFMVVIDNEIHRFNLELSVDVQSFLHSAFSVADTETTAEFIKVLESHCAQWGKPLALVTVHGSANLSNCAQTYIRNNDIEILPAGPANPKGNGTAESAFSGMEKVIGAIHLDTSSPHALAKGVLEKILSVYITMRNRLSRQDTKCSPEQMIGSATTAQQRQKQKTYFQERAKKRKKPASTKKQERLQWLISHHGMKVDEKSMKRAMIR